MRVPSPMRLAALTLLVGGLACAKNNPDETVGAARDTTTTGISDSANSRQDQSGVTDSSGQSTLGKDVTRTRPDQGQPVTSKGDTINAGVDSAAAQQPSTQVPSDSQSDSQAPVSSDSVSPRSDTSMVAPSADSMSMNHGADSSSMNQGGNSSTVNSGVDSATTGAVVDTATPSATSPSTTSTTTDSSTAR